MIQRHTYPSSHRLKSRKDITALFESSASVFQHPILIKYRLPSTPELEPKCAFVCPKKKFKQSVTRNLLKRRMREAWRTNWRQINQLHNLRQFPHIMMIYTSSDIIDYDVISRSICISFDKVCKEIMATQVS